MTIKKFIESAIKGGWTHKSREFYRFESGTEENLSSIFLDPEAWKACGKTEGWDDGEHIDRTYKFAWPGKYMWHHKWHNLIDHLADGGNIEEYIATL